MRKIVVVILSLALLCAASGALAAGVTLRTFTPFADVDFAAQGYMDMITAWEAETGNVIEDYSGATDGGWLANMRALIGQGQADVVVLPVGSGMSVQELVTAGELEAAAPGIGVKKFASMKEGDGSLLLAPLRLYWEGLYVNTDVLARYNLPVPDSFEALLSACAVLSQNGVTPIANALCEWNEIVLDCAALMGAPAEQYGQAASLDGALSVMNMLAAVGGFGPDPWNASDMDAEGAFLSGAAAMRFDADVLAQLVDEARADSVQVIPLPAQDGQPRAACVGTPAFGVAITRACWNDPARREAAISLVAKMLGEQALITPAAGALGESIAALCRGAQDMTGILYDLNPNGFDAWAEGVIAKMMNR